MLVRYYRKTASIYVYNKCIIIELVIPYYQKYLMFFPRGNQHPLPPPLALVPYYPC